MRVSVVGSGYVGLVTGACLAEKGHEVVCVDLDAAKVDRINSGSSPIFERDLDALLLAHAGKRLRATTDLAAAVSGSELTFIAVGTPFDGRSIDLRPIRQAAAAVGEALRVKAGYHTVVVKSTVVPGTTDEVVAPQLEAASGKRAGTDFGVGMNPEFLTEGEAVSDFMNPDRIVLGAGDPRALEAMAALYAVFPGIPLVRTNCKTAEMIKYASNALLATLISFSNELANLGATLQGVDAAEVMEALHLSRYLLPLAPDGTPVRPSIVSFLMPGCGFGGSCLPKDVNALVAHGRQAGEPMHLLKAVMDVNDAQPRRMVDLVRKRFPSMAGVPMAVLGLSFRPDTDDMRESPAIPVIHALLAEGARLRVYDPAAMDEARRRFGDSVEYAASTAGCLEGARAALLITRWREFSSLPGLLAAMPEPPILFDGRRQIPRAQVPDYEAIGL